MDSTKNENKTQSTHPEYNVDAILQKLLAVKKYDYSF